MDYVHTTRIIVKLKSTPQYTMKKTDWSRDSSAFRLETEFSCAAMGVTNLENGNTREKFFSFWETGL